MLASSTDDSPSIPHSSLNLCCVSGIPASCRYVRYVYFSVAIFYNTAPSHCTFRQSAIKTRLSNRIQFCSPDVLCHRLYQIVPHMRVYTAHSARQREKFQHNTLATLRRLYLGKGCEHRKAVIGNKLMALRHYFYHIN